MLVGGCAVRSAAAAAAAPILSATGIPGTILLVLLLFVAACVCAPLLYRRFPRRVYGMYDSIPVQV